MSVKSLVILLNSPSRNASIDRALQKITVALDVALEQIGNSMDRSGRADELKKLLKIALHLSRTKGTYEGLCQGSRLQQFKSKIEDDPRLRYLTSRIRKFPDGTGQGRDGELCAYLDKQVRRLRELVTVSEEQMPLPLKSWGATSWSEAIRKKSSAVSKYISVSRKMVLSDEFTFLLAWERTGKSVPGGPRKKVDHRDLHLDKLYE
jgi:hypothetical protein